MADKPKSKSKPDIERLPTVLRSAEGTIEFPSVIPPQVEVPSYLSPVPLEEKHQAPTGGQVGLSKSKSTPDASGASGSEYASAQSDGGLDALEGRKVGGAMTGRNKALPLLPRAVDGAVTDSQDDSTGSLRGGARPNFRKVFQTDRPQASRKPTIPNMMRSGTQVSALNQAIWNHQNSYSSADSSSDSSSSESESDSDDEPPQRHFWQRKQKPDPAQGSSIKAKQKRRDFRRFSVGNDGFKSKGKVSKNDGRLAISMKDTSNSGYLAKALGAAFVRGFGRDENEEDEYNRRKREGKGTLKRADTGELLITKEKRIVLNIVIMVIGSRGDIQPFLKLGKVLKEEYGHRVRIATHPAFRDFVQNDSGLEFFSVGGDPSELMAFMVKNPGMIPSLETLKKGEVGKRRAAMAEMFEGFWRACINATDDERDKHNLKMMGDRHPFVADAIIANPPSFAHVHCAERLGIPLHLMFTFPYTPTADFPHPLANIKKTNVDPGYINFISYPLVEMMTWQGLGDLVNDFRVRTLGLEPVSTLWAPGQLYRLRVPYTYMWSPGLVPKPSDWGPEIDIAGFVFLDLASNFKPPKELEDFLNAGDPPVYIGFGSIVVDDPDKFTEMIYKATEMAGVRALVSKGWGGFGGDDSPENVYMLENTPHDWLFPKVKAVVHHGGAGTTAIGLKCGKPTLVVPFFGDQFFWGNMIGKAGAGAMPIPYKELTAENLAEAIKFLLKDSTQEAADEFARKIEEEGDGAENAVRSFHKSLTLRGEHSMRCSILDDQLAVWSVKNTNMRLSALAADILREHGRIQWNQLRLLRHVEWNDFEGPGEPLTGGATALGGNLASAAAGFVGIPFRLVKSAKKRKTDEEKKVRRERRRKARELRQEKRGARNKRMHNHMHHNGTANGAPITAAGGPNADPELTQGIASQDMLPEDQMPERVLSNLSQASKGTGRKQSKQSKTSNRSPSQPQQQDDDYTDDDGTSFATTATENSHDAAEEIAHDIEHGLKKTGHALARAPLDLSAAVAQGFHNAPRLYGDTTVRRPIRITGMHSGLKAAGREFTLGVYDGVTGIVTQPVRGAKERGVWGFVQGIGMGVTGFVLKDLAAIVGPVAYTLKGVQKEVGKKRQPTHFIRRARIMQGRKDLAALSGERKKEVERKVLHGWGVMKEIWRAMDQERERGFRGRVKRFRERKTWRVNVDFDNVEMAEKALRALKVDDRKTLDEIWEMQRVEREEAKRRREELHQRRPSDERKSEERRKESEEREKAKKSTESGRRSADAAVGDEPKKEQWVQRDKSKTEPVKPSQDLVDGQVNGQVNGAARAIV